MASYDILVADPSRFIALANHNSVSRKAAHDNRNLHQSELGDFDSLFIGWWDKCVWVADSQTLSQPWIWLAGIGLFDAMFARVKSL